jgi:hypothetical protein
MILSGNASVVLVTAFLNVRKSGPFPNTGPQFLSIVNAYSGDFIYITFEF